MSPRHGESSGISSPRLWGAQGQTSGQVQSCIPRDSVEVFQQNPVTCPYIIGWPCIRGGPTPHTPAPTSRTEQVKTDIQLVLDLAPLNGSGGQLRQNAWASDRTIGPWQPDQKILHGQTGDCLQSQEGVMPSGLPVLRGFNQRGLTHKAAQEAIQGESSRGTPLHVLQLSEVALP